MSDADSKRRPKNATTPQRSVRFEVREKPLPPPPRPMSKALDFDDEPPELYPRNTRMQSASLDRARAPEGRAATPASPSTRQRAPESRGAAPGSEPARARAPGGRAAPGSEPARARAPGGRSTSAPAGLREQLHAPVVATAADLDHARAIQMQSAPAPARSVFPIAGQASPWGWLQSPWVVLLIGAACLVIYLLASTPGKVVFSNYGSGGASIAQNNAAAPPPLQNGEHSVLGAPTITAEQIEAILSYYRSPAAGTGAAWIASGQKYGIDPAYALAFFIHESTAGTNPGWAGLKPDGSSTHNIGNIICAGYPSCFGRFRDYASWDDGIDDWYKLIANEYVGGRGVQTVEQIIPIYAPAFENNVNGYVGAVISLVDAWHQGKVAP